ncbi:holin [Mycobacterium phage Weirdo19]|uniref:Holin n=1 Tax=Mycobacterium phage Weirdo19 TaxID=2601610 RepID=A0A6M2YSS5_9CAUD|nr:holin [Mycobacterium phage Weirdo19]QEA10796.1 holin [Mycobacterium phage Weirdo19]
MSAYLKAILAFVSLLVTNIAADLTAGGQPWPTDGGEWARWLLTITLGTWLVYQLPNSAHPRTPRA